MKSIKDLFIELLETPIRVREWQVLSKHPDLLGEEWITRLTRERETYRKTKKFKTIQRISSKLILLRKCQEIGSEKAFFGRVLEDEQRFKIEKSIPSTLLQKVRLAQELKRDAKCGSVTRTGLNGGAK